MADLADEYLNGRVTRGELTAGSAQIVGYRLAGLIRAHSNDPPDALDRASLLEWQATIGTLQPTSRRQYQSAVQQFCRWLVDEGHLDSDPSTRLAKIKVSRRVPRALNEDQIHDLLASISNLRMWAVAWLMLGCGLRCVEVSRLDLADWDRRAGTLEIRGKAWHERILPIPRPTEHALNLYLVERGLSAGPLILAERPTPENRERRLHPRQLSRQMAAQLAVAGIHMPGDGRTAHALRHTCASDVLERCGDVTVVQEMLGHASLETTQIYLRRTSASRLRSAMEGRFYGYAPPDTGQLRSGVPA